MEQMGAIDREPQDLFSFKAGSCRLAQFPLMDVASNAAAKHSRRGADPIKYFVTAALVLALAGAASSALADPPPDEHDHKDAHADHAPPPKKAPPVKNKQQTIDREDTHLHNKQQVFDNKDAALHKEQSGLDRKADQLHNEQAAIDRKADQGHPGLGYKSHGLRPRDQGRVEFSVNLFPAHFSVGRRFHVDGYGYPGGWYAHSWGYGDYLPVGWFAPQFYLDFGSFGLTTPPIGCEWVREGPDAVLIDVYTGQVLSVANGVFY